MAQTEAQRKASLKYVKEHVKRLELRFYPSEEELYQLAKKIGSTGIKTLLLEYTEKIDRIEALVEAKRKERQ